MDHGPDEFTQGEITLHRVLIAVVAFLFLAMAVVAMTASQPSYGVVLVLVAATGFLLWLVYWLRPSNSKLGHSQSRIRTLAFKYGQHRNPQKNILRTENKWCTRFLDSFGFQPGRPFRCRGGESRS
jgi:hypothetical protein